MINDVQSESPLPSHGRHAPHEDTRDAVRNGLEVLRRGKWIIVTLTLMVTAAAAAYFAFVMEPRYTADALLLVEIQSSSAADETLNVGFIEGSPFESRNVANQVLILQRSQLVASRTAQQLIDMQTVPGTDETLSMLTDADGQPRAVESLARVLQDQFIAVRRAEEAADEKADAIWITATGSHPKEAALLANLYAEEYVKRTKETSRERITSSRIFLEKQLETRRAELRDIEEELKELARGGAVSLDAETQRTIEQVADLEVQLDEARIEQRMREAALTSVEEELDALQPRLASRLASDAEAEMKLVQDKLARLQLLAEEARIRVEEGVEDADREELNRLNAHIAKLKSHLGQLSDQHARELVNARGINPDDEANPYIGNLYQQAVAERVQMNGAKAKAEALQQRLDAYEAKLEAIPQQSMELAQVQRAHQSTEQLYNRLIETLQEVKLAEESEIGTARIIRPAFAPQMPSWGRGWNVIALGLLLGLALGVVGAIMRHRLDVRVYMPDDVSNLGFSLSGVIPDLGDQVRMLFDGRDTVEVDDGQSVSTMLPALHAPMSPEAEAYRRLYVGLQFSRPDVVAQAILVTSPEKGVGKSTTALNLAITAAQTGRRVLIVDADLRRPALHKLLGRADGPSLPSLLADNDLPAERDFAQSYFYTGIENLWAVTTEEPVSEPSRLLRSTNMQTLVQQLREYFDIVVFDAPPVLVASECVLLAAQCDRTVVVAGAGTTASDALEKTVTELEAVGAHVGTVLNRFDPSGIYGYKHTYKYIQEGYEYAA